MTKEQKIEAYEMILNGESHRAVGEKFGVSKQYVQSLIPARGIRMEAAAESCVYPNIAEWMRENKMGFSKIARAIGMTPQTVRHSLTGEGEPRKYLIDSMLKLTEMTYEQAFYKED
jgi:transposase-like protein